MRRLSVNLLALLALAAPLGAQRSTTIGAFELRPVVGAYVPTGTMRNEFRDAALFGLQSGFEFNSNIHMLLGGFFSRNDTHVSFVGSKQADIWQLDAGVEANTLSSMGRDWLFRPFLGGGLGMRMYDYSAGGNSRCFASYAAAGLEFQRFQGALRAEARDYVSCYESPLTGDKKTRNDVGLTLGFVYHVM